LSSKKMPAGGYFLIDAAKTFAAQAKKCLLAVIF
jgi:hypothetical protein